MVGLETLASSCIIYLFPLCVWVDYELYISFWDSMQDSEKQIMKVLVISNVSYSFFQAQGLRRCIEEIVFSFSYPRLDMEVGLLLSAHIRSSFLLAMYVNFFINRNCFCFRSQSI